MYTNNKQRKKKKKKKKIIQYINKRVDDLISEKKKCKASSDLHYKTKEIALINAKLSLIKQKKNRIFDL
jgi:TATA-binding protein-associated factor Taf7